MEKQKGTNGRWERESKKNQVENVWLLCKLDLVMHEYLVCLVLSCETISLYIPGSNDPHATLMVVGVTL